MLEMTACCACLLLHLLSKARVDALQSARGGRLDYAVLNCAAQTSSAAAQELLESNLVKRGSR
jgi:hypothetical protein